MTTDRDLLAADEQARSAALDVTRSFIVQAPAGSGKTELLIQRYLSLLATVAEPEEVVAITFTNKAANEMQARVVAALERARRGEVAAQAHEARTLAAAARILERDAAHGWQLLELPRRLRIMTLDAFCGSVTRLLPVSSGLGGGLATSADAAMQRLYREAAIATLDWLPGGDTRAVAVECVLEHLDNDVAAYLAYLVRMLAKRDQWLKLTGAGAGERLETIRHELEATIGEQICAQLRLVREQFAVLGGADELGLLRHAGERMTEASGAAHPLAALPVTDWPAAAAEQAPLWRAIAEQLLTKKGELRKQVDVRCGFPPQDGEAKQAFKEWLARLAGVAELAELLDGVARLPDARYRDEQWVVLVALFDVLPLAVAELQRLFAARGLTDHVEVAQAAAAALGSVDEPGELALLLDYRIRHLLVDEMQDTSIGQYRLLEQLTAGWERGDGRTLFCVGDPMQSIYRFRDAEVGQFVAARRHGLGDVSLEPLLLRRNFRSGERLVDWFNDVFPRVLPARDDATTGAVAYADSVSVDAHAGAGEVRVHALVDADPVAEAERSADVIGECLAADGHGRVAVLVRSRTQLPQLLAELRRRGVGCEAIEIDRLTDLPEVIDLLSLTRALCHDGDRLAWLALLRAPFAGLTWRDLLRLVINDRHATVRELAADPERLAALSDDGRERLRRLLDVLAEQPAAAGRTLRERVETLWLALDGPAALSSSAQLANAYRYLDALGRLEAAGTLADVALLEEQLDAERVSTPGDESTRVQVMTMHKAKGLQFDHVVLHGLGRQPASGEQDVLAWLPVTRADGTSGLILSPPGARSEQEADPLYRFIVQAGRDSDAHELGRLLYVACTRAVRSLHLVGSVATLRDGSELGAPPVTTLLHRLWPMVADEFERVFAAHDPTTRREDERPTFAAPELRRLVAPAAEMPAAPPAARGAELTETREVSFDWVGSSLRHAGTIVHRWLERLAGQDGAAPPDDVAATSRRWARGLGVAEPDLDGVVARVEAALAAVGRDERARWLLAGEGAAELALSGLEDGRVVRIVIDRVKVDGDVHWLVDYKTSMHEGGDLAGFLRQEAERYRDQLRRYRDVYREYAGVPVRTALYFPLLGEFLEVDVDAAS